MFFILATLVEYCMHRWLHAPHSNCSITNTHKEHHREYKKQYYYRKEKRLKCIQNITTGFVLTTAALNLEWPSGYARNLMLEMVAGVLLYQMSHILSHMPPHTTLHSKIVCWHHHHHQYNHRSNFGISCPVWDFVFGTCSENANCNSYVLASFPLLGFMFVDFKHRDCST